GVFLSQVPVQRQAVCETRHQLAEIEFAFDAKVSSIQGHGNMGARGVPAEPVIVVLGLLQLEMQVQTLPLRVIKDDLPLIELRAVIVELIVPLGKWPDVVSVAARVVSKERDRVGSL